MWSHYADGHKGFVIGIDMIIMEVFQEHLAHYKTLLDLQPIIYEEQLPEINYFESMMSKDGERDIIRLLMTKSAHWSYEHEYRLIFWDKVDFGFPIPADCISEIILGCDIQPDDERNLCQAILASSINPAIFKSRVHETDFRLIIEKSE